jgi:hypothetical protein
MQGANTKRWRELCEQATTEQDPQKLLSLIEEVNKLLEAKQHHRLENTASAD